MSVCEQITQLKHHVLIIDDHREYFQRAAQILLDEYEVQLLSSIELGVRLLNECSRYPDIIVLSLPETKSDVSPCYEALQDWAFGKDIPVLYASEYLDDIKDSHSLSCKVYDWIEQPLKPAELKIRLRKQLTIHNEKKIAEIASYFDPVTGIGNVRKFNEVIFRSWNECLLNNQKIGLLLIDIDDFKAFNQCHGFNYGDLVLQMIAEELEAFVTGPTDCVCTLEGNQFALLKPCCSGYELEDLADQVIAKTQDLQIRSASLDDFNFLSVSVGGYSMYPEKKLTYKTLIQEADLSLFNAKTRGGNCAEIRTRHAVANIFNLGFAEATVRSIAS